MTDPDGARPEWWRENQQYKDCLDLPEYDPPRFRDGVYLHAVVDPLEARYGCRISFVTDEVGYPVDWQVRVDGDPVFTIGRHRDADGNTVYEMDAADFSDRLTTELSS